MAKSNFTITAIGAVSTDLSSRKEYPEGLAVQIITSEDKQREFLGGSPCPINYDLLQAAQTLGIDRKSALLAFRKSCQETTAHLLRTSVGRDYLLIQSVNALDDLNVILNMMTTRLREIYGMHYPELSVENPDNEGFAKKVLLGEARNANSVGIQISESDMAAVNALAQNLLSVFEEKKSLEKYVETLAGEIAPHVCESAGNSMAARIIAKAGSLERLAFMPSSTVQVLGAEKALFKHLTRGTPCPKHGIIFQHPQIQSAQKKLRGKAARKLSAKISISSRIDYFSSKG